MLNVVMHQRGDGDSGESAEVFVDPKTDMYLFCHFAPPFFPSSVFFGLCCFLFCRDAPFEKLVYILAVITAELVLRVFIQTVKMPSAALTQLQQQVDITADTRQPAFIVHTSPQFSITLVF